MSPPRLRVLEGAIIVVVLAGICSQTIYPFSPGGRIVLLLVLFAAALIARETEESATRHLALFGLFAVAVPLVHPLLWEWPWFLMVPLAAYGLTCALTPSLRRSTAWLRRGGFPRGTLPMVLFTIVVSTGALLAWVAVLDPDMKPYTSHLPDLAPWQLPIAALGFAALNAALEETVYRGIAMEALEKAFGTGLISLAVQALAFAAAHYASGFPSGAAGSVLVFAYGVILGLIRRRSGGLLAPWVAHVAADVTIFLIVVAVAAE